MPKVTVPPELYDKVKTLAGQAGYSSPEEFIIHLLETAVSHTGGPDQDADVLERLRGLGYIS